MSPLSVLCNILLPLVLVTMVQSMGPSDHGFHQPKRLHGEQNLLSKDSKKDKASSEDIFKTSAQNHSETSVIQALM